MKLEGPSSFELFKDSSFSFKRGARNCFAMSAGLDAIIGLGSATESASLSDSLQALTPQTFETRLANRTTSSVPENQGVHCVAAVALIQAITGTTQQNANGQWNRIKHDLLNTTSGTCSFTGSFRFPRQRGPLTDVIDTTTALQVIMRLRGKTAERFRLKASVLLVRFLSGDMTLVAEVYGMNKLQSYLKEAHPDHPLALIASTAQAQGLVPVTQNDGATDADLSVVREQALREETEIRLQHLRRMNELVFDTTKLDLAEESAAKRVRRDQETATVAEELAARSAAARAKTRRENEICREHDARRVKELDADLERGIITAQEHAEGLEELLPKRADQISVRDFILRLLRGDARLAATVEREAQRLVRVGEHPKPRSHYDNLGRVKWFIELDREFLRGLYNAELDKRAGIKEGQKRLGFATDSSPPWRCT